MFLHRLGKVHAPEFPPRLKWFNSEPLRMKKLLGKPVLIDFWTYSCVNCIRTLPHVNAWHEKYADMGLTIIGVHTPEFEFEKDPDNVARAIKKYKISYPVVLDPNYKIWNLFTNRWWPRKFLIDAQGQIIYDHVGEGGYAETEQAIQQALSQTGVKEFPGIKPDVSVGGGICYRTTPETYLGYMRGRFGNAHDMIPNAESVFTDGDAKEEDLVYLHGHWKLGVESLKHDRKLSAASEYLSLKYSAFSVNLVAGSTNRRSAVLEVELDSQPLPEDMAGEDVVIEGGKALLKITQHRLYRVIDSDTYHRGTLRLKTPSDNLELFAFTFGGCKGM